MNSLESTFHSTVYPHPLWVRGSLCANPECECGDVFLELLDHADGGGAKEGPPVLEMRVDTETWQELDPPARPLGSSGSGVFARVSASQGAARGGLGTRRWECWSWASSCMA